MTYRWSRVSKRISFRSNPSRTWIAGWNDTSRPIRGRSGGIGWRPKPSLGFDSSRARWRAANTPTTCLQETWLRDTSPCWHKHTAPARPGSCLGYMPSPGVCAWTDTAGLGASRCTRLGRWRLLPRSSRRQPEARNLGSRCSRATLVAALPEAQREVVTMLKVERVDPGRSSSAPLRLPWAPVETEGASTPTSGFASYLPNPGRGNGERSASVNYHERRPRALPAKDRGYSGRGARGNL